ncbi:TPA: hypothetical protein ACPYY3_005338, partial [Klebsiella oxytoca]
NPPSALTLPGLQLRAVWSPGQGASSAASGKIHRPHSRSRGYSSARSGSPDKARQAPPTGKSTIRAYA